jgi:hypothetical protein
MPRDFVPCLYREHVLEHPRLLDMPVLTCDVIELFDVCDVETHEPGAVLGLNSHQYTMRDTYSVSPHADLTETQRSGMRVLLRDQLFRTFYAAMTALE